MAIEISFRVKIPSNFDAYSILSIEEKPARREKMRNGMNYFLSLLIPSPLERGKRKELEDTGYISLNSAMFKAIIGIEYNDAIKTVRKIQCYRKKYALHCRDKK